jgi:hypothetical protein
LEIQIIVVLGPSDFSQFSYFDRFLNNRTSGRGGSFSRKRVTGKDDYALMNLQIIFSLI